MTIFDEILMLVTKIPKGKVTTYGAIAKKLGIPNPRVVGFALHSNKNPDIVPCHRVVNRFGKMAKGYAFGGTDIQRKLLLKEGVSFADEQTVDLEKSLYNFL